MCFEHDSACAFFLSLYRIQACMYVPYYVHCTHLYMSVNKLIWATNCVNIVYLIFIQLVSAHCISLHIYKCYVLDDDDMLAFDCDMAKIYCIYILYRMIKMPWYETVEHNFWSNNFQSNVTDEWNMENKRSGILSIKLHTKLSTFD